MRISTLARKRLWYHAKLLKSNAGVRSRVEGDRLYERISLISSRRISCRRRSTILQARGLVSGVKVSTHEKNVHKAETGLRDVHFFQNASGYGEYRGSRRCRAQSG